MIFKVLVPPKFSSKSSETNIKLLLDLLLKSLLKLQFKILLEGFLKELLVVLLKVILLGAFEVHLSVLIVL